MELTPEQQKAVEQQKANCIFCQIVAGNIPSKKVYDDDKLLGILDINPASKGHTLLMPKEHYPIMPLIPPDTFKQLAIKTKAVDAAIKEALLCSETTVMIANGGAAGQQSNHFMLHIIPREKGDGLPFDTEGKTPDNKETEEVIEKVKPAVSAMLGRNLASMGYTKADTTAPRMTKQQIIQIINANQALKQIILEKPEQFKQIVPTHPQLGQLLAGFNLDDIIETVKRQQEGAKKSTLSFGGGQR